MNGADTLVTITRNGMGKADDSLSQKLLAKWLELVSQNGNLPGAICFYTEGVKLVVEGSPVLDQLQAFESQGVHLIVCATCLDFFGIRDQLRVGIVGGMGDIIAAQWKAQKVLAL